MEPNKVHVVTIEDKISTTNPTWKLFSQEWCVKNSFDVNLCRNSDIVINLLAKKDIIENESILKRDRVMIHNKSYLKVSLLLQLGPTNIARVVNIVPEDNESYKYLFYACSPEDEIRKYFFKMIQEEKYSNFFWIRIVTVTEQEILE